MRLVKLETFSAKIYARVQVN